MENGMAMTELTISFVFLQANQTPQLIPLRHDLAERTITMEKDLRRTFHMAMETVPPPRKISNQIQ